MTRYIAAGVIFWCQILASTTANAEAFSLMGAGVNSCGTFAKMFAADPKRAGDFYFSWAQGFFSGQNTAALLANEPSKDLSSISTEEQEAFLRSYCDAHPLANYEDGVMRLYYSFKTNSK
jgi:hypothetical protein